MSLLTTIPSQAIPYPLVGTMSHTAQGYVIPRKSTYTSLEKATLFSEVFSTSRPESTQFMLFGRIAPDWILRYPLSLTIVPYDLGGYLVSDERVCVYGMGETKSEALDEYKSMLVDLFEELRSSEKVLSPRLLEQLKHLRSIIKRG